MRFCTFLLIFFTKSPLLLCVTIKKAIPSTSLMRGLHYVGLFLVSLSASGNSGLFLLGSLRAGRCFPTG